jgi:hypothetical protein
MLSVEFSVGGGVGGGLPRRVPRLAPRLVPTLVLFLLVARLSPQIGGYVYARGRLVYDVNGVRPALWLNL